jgi:hypothetical protein
MPGQKKQLIRFSRARQNMEYKFVELLSCNFIASPEDVIRAHICFRYNTLKSRLALVQARLQDIESLIKVQIIICTHIYPHVYTHVQMYNHTYYAYACTRTLLHVYRMRTRTRSVCVFLGVVCVCVWCRLIFRFLARVLPVYTLVRGR